MHQVTMELRRRGFANESVRQLLAGEVITIYSDRLKIAAMLHAEKNQDYIHAEKDQNYIHAEKNQDNLFRARLTASGRIQCLAGLPVTEAADRRVLASLILAAFTRDK